MTVNGIYGYNSYSYQTTMNMLRLSSVKSFSGAVSPVQRIPKLSSSAPSSAASAFTDIQDFLKSYESELTGLESAASKLMLSSRNNVFQDYQAGSTDESVATVSGSYRLNADLNMDLDVQSLAQAQKNVSGERYAMEKVQAGADMNFEIQGSSGMAAISVSSTNANGTARTYNEMYQDAAKAINAQSDLGVKASVSNVDGKVSLVLTAKDTGERNGFTVTGDMGAAAGAEVASVQAQDAVYTVTENGYSQTQRSSSNKVSLLYGKIDAELKGTGKTNVYTGVDEDEIVSAVKDLVKQYNSVSNLLKDNADRGTGAAAHLASFNRGMADEKTLKSLGITYDKDGQLQVDEEKLKSALETDFEGIVSLIGGQYGMAEKAASRADSALSDSVQRIVNNSLGSPVQQSDPQGGSFSQYQYFSNFASRGAFHLSNYYTVGMLLNTMA